MTPSLLETLEALEEASTKQLYFQVCDSDATELLEYIRQLQRTTDREAGTINLGGD